MNNSTTCNTTLLHTAICFKTKPIQSLLHIATAKNMLAHHKNIESGKALEDHIAILENNFLSIPRHQNHESAEKALLHIMLDLKSYIMNHQHEHADAYHMHQKLSQTYALITQLVEQCYRLTQKAIIATKKYNESVLAQEGYSYPALVQCCDRIIQHLYTR